MRAFPQPISTTYRLNRQVSLVSVNRRGMAYLPDLQGRAFTTLAQAAIEVLFISQSSSEGDFCFIGQIVPVTLVRKTTLFNSCLTK